MNRMGSNKEVQLLTNGSGNLTVQCPSSSVQGKCENNLRDLEQPTFWDQCHQLFPCKMMSEKLAQKFQTNDMLLPKSV